MINEPRIMNLEQALSLYSIINTKLSNKEDTLSFVEDLLTKLTPNEYLDCVCLLTGTKKEQIIEQDFMEAIISFTKGLQINNIIYLCELMKKFGLV
jgi:hypothetical protein